jgi:cytochrome c5
MLNILKYIVLLAASALIIAACGEGEAPATSSTSKTAPAATATETPPAVEVAPEAVTEPAPAMEFVPEIAEPEPAPVPVPEIAEPEPAPAPATPPVETVAPVEPAAEPPAESPAPVTTSTASLDGGQLYNSYCAICHKAGLNAAPKYGSKPLWAKRIAQGRETMYANAINGLRGMPPRGGFAQLTDDEVKAATDYMVKAAGGWGDN